MTREERARLWRRAIDEWASDHLDVDQIDAYLRGDVDLLERRRAAAHVERCEACRQMHDERRAEGVGVVGPSIVLPLERLRGLGWMWQMGGATLAAAGAEEATETESVATEAGQLDAWWSSSGALMAAVSQAGQPRAGWRVRLQRMSADGRVVRDEAEAMTDDTGRAELVERPAQMSSASNESFRVIARVPFRGEQT